LEQKNARIGRVVRAAVPSIIGGNVLSAAGLPFVGIPLATYGTYKGIQAYREPLRKTAAGTSDERIHRTNRAVAAGLSSLVSGTLLLSSGLPHRIPLLGLPFTAHGLYKAHEAYHAPLPKTAAVTEGLRHAAELLSPRER
jgi:hypothetical protein